MKRLPLILPCLVLVLLAGAALAQKKSGDVVKTTVKAEKPDADGKQVVTVTLEIEKPYHLYANPVGHDDFASNQTVLSFTSKLDDTKIQYPEGQLVKDKTVGDYRTYEGKVEIKATVKRAKGDTSPLKMTLKVQACDDKLCLPPARIPLTAE